MSSGNKKFILDQILWLGISLGISFAISMILPFPTSLVAIIGVFILLNIFMRRIMMKRTGVKSDERAIQTIYRTEKAPMV